MAHTWQREGLRRGHGKARLADIVVPSLLRGAGGVWRGCQVARKTAPARQANGGTSEHIVCCRCARAILPSLARETSGPCRRMGGVGASRRVAFKACNFASGAGPTNLGAPRCCLLCAWFRVSQLPSLARRVRDRAPDDRPGALSLTHASFASCAQACSPRTRLKPPALRLTSCMAWVLLSTPSCRRR